SSRRRHTRLVSDWSSDVCSSDLNLPAHYAPYNIAVLAGGVLLGVGDVELAPQGGDVIGRVMRRQVGVGERAEAARAQGHLLEVEIGRASCRGRVSVSECGVTLVK